MNVRRAERAIVDEPENELVHGLARRRRMVSVRSHPSSLYDSESSTTRNPAIASTVNTPSAQLSSTRRQLKKRYADWLVAPRPHGYVFASSGTTQHVHDVRVDLISAAQQDIAIRFGRRLRTLRVARRLTQVE